MGHAHPHDHEHGAVHAGVGRSAQALRTAFLINAAFTLVEAVGGWWTNSIAVLTDALHDLGDCLVLGLAWHLLKIAQRGRDARYSYGYGRYSMLGGWLSAWILIIGAVLMTVNAVPRLFHPQLPDTGGMMAIAVFGLLMNGLAAWRLHDGHTLNERGAYLHLLEDVLGWAAVLLGAVLIRYTGWAAIDPLLSIAISLYIAWNAIGTLRKGTGILMQADAGGADPSTVRNTLLALPRVIGVHDQHTWSLDGAYTVLTVHLVIDSHELETLTEVKSLARKAMRKLGIEHATIETERPGEDCELQHH